MTKMRVLGHMYHLGWGWGGGVVTLCLVLEELRLRGHSVGLMLQRGSLKATRTHGGRTFGIEDVYAAPLPVAKRRRYRDADIVITQGEATPEAMALCRAHQKPLAHLIHDEGQLDYHKAKPALVQLAIYNAEWVRRAAAEKGRADNAIVVYPIVHPEDYVPAAGTEAPHDSILLVNLCEEKGGKLFWELARQMPEHKFLGVMGGWGGQIRPERLPPNAEVMEHNLDPREFYARARIVLMPSQDLGTPGMRHWTESYGRIGIEAAASGIPTLAHPTPGLVESLGEAGTFCDRFEPSQWVQTIKELDDPEFYAEASAAALKRSAEMEPTQHMDALEAELVRLAAFWREAERNHPRPGDLRVPPLTEEGTVRLRALRRLAGRASIGEVFEVLPHIGGSLIRRGLAELVDEEAPLSRPEAPPRPAAATGSVSASGVQMTYRSGAGKTFPTREARAAHEREEAEAVAARTAAAESATTAFPRGEAVLR